VERLGEVLLKMGLARQIGATVDPPLKATSFNDAIDPGIGARNIDPVARLAVAQANRIEAIVRDNEFPVVLGGDDSVLFGCLLAMRRIGSVGLFLLDGHTDFWNPLNGSGELSDSDIWISTGRGVPQIGNLEDLAPFVRDQACVLYGHRDRDFQLTHGSDVGFTGNTKIWTEHSKDRIGTTYRKALFREYTEETFATEKTRPPKLATAGCPGGTDSG
jgi:arginase